MAAISTCIRSGSSRSKRAGSRVSPLLQSSLEALAAWPGAVWLARSGTAYLLVNAAHILGIGLLVGAILPLDLRLAGCFRSFPMQVLAPFLSRAAACGMVLALLTGAWLFSVKPIEYVENTAFLVKMGLLGLALLNITAQHFNRHYREAVAGGRVHVGVRGLATMSALCWLSVLVAGRWIGFL